MIYETITNRGPIFWRTESQSCTTESLGSADLRSGKMYGPGFVMVSPLRSRGPFSLHNTLRRLLCHGFIEFVPYEIRFSLDEVWVI